MLGRATRQEPTVSRVICYVKKDWPSHVNCVDDHLKVFQYKRDELSLVSECLLWSIHAIVLKRFRAGELGELHCYHLGTVRMKKLVRSYF